MKLILWLLLALCLLAGPVCADDERIIGSGFDFLIKNLETKQERPVTLYIEKKQEFNGCPVYWVMLADPAGDEGGLEYDLFDPEVGEWIGRVSKRIQGFPLVHWPIFEPDLFLGKQWESEQVCELKGGGSHLSDLANNSSLELIAIHPITRR